MFVGRQRLDHRPAGGGRKQRVEVLDEAPEHRMVFEEIAAHVPELAALAGAGEHELAVVAGFAGDDGRRLGLVALRPVAAFRERCELGGEIGVVAREHDGAVIELRALPRQRAGQCFERRIGQRAAVAHGFGERARPGGEVRLSSARKSESG